MNGQRMSSARGRVNKRGECRVNHRAEAGREPWASDEDREETHGGRAAEDPSEFEARAGNA